MTDHLAPKAADDEDERLRQHITAFVLDLLDPGVDHEQRLISLRHIVACDPGRGIGLLATMCRHGITELEHRHDDPPGTVVAALRQELRSAIWARLTSDPAADLTEAATPPPEQT